MIALQGLKPTGLKPTGLKPLARAAILALTSTLALSSSALSAELTKFRYALIANPGIWDAAVINAMDRNFFADEGLEVELISPNSPADGLKLGAPAWPAGSVTH